ncbi:MAG: response regulator [Verrucomicrobiales bacterium]
MKLLIVDDSFVVRQVIERQALGSELEQVLQAADGLEAVRLFEQYRPSIVTMDLTMPNLDGLECIGQLKAIEPNTSILVISALNSHETAMEAIARGACGFLTKPFAQLELEEALQELLLHAQKNQAI